jgi:16S rRNA (uracil1498-N3)-methyltransferase
VDLPGLGTVGPHVFVPSLVDDEIAVEGEEAHHLTSVLRTRTGAPVSLADGAGAVAQATVRSADRQRVVVAVGRRITVPLVEPAVCVVQALPKARKMEEVVQRLTEVGVDRIRPVVTARTVKQVDGKADRVLARWRAVALAAARQSRRARLLRIEPVSSWPPAGAVGAVLWEGASTPLSQVLSEVLSGVVGEGVAELTLAIGPEGGFDEREVEQAEGLVPAALGSTILRTETAGLVAATVLLHRLGRLG